MSVAHHLGLDIVVAITYQTECEECKKIFYGKLSIAHNIVMNLNNVIRVVALMTLYYN
jgi:hypothetical protein